ncbi:hypothetical protein AB0J38_41085 [Streptomyces sp. NPDC050095]|uniref:hypothetical protein n=1 Tax=unclassified Streptomyces TaxID=2593676 RepID=UPI0034171D86
MSWKYMVERCGAKQHDGECGPWAVANIKWGADWKAAYRLAEELPHAIVTRAYMGNLGWSKTPHTVFEHYEGGGICKGCADRSRITGDPISPESRGPLVQTPAGNEFMCAPCQKAFIGFQKKITREPNRWLYVPIIDTLDWEAR